MLRLFHAVYTLAPVAAVGTDVLLQTLAILGLVGDGLLEPRLAHGAAGGVALHGE